MPTAVVHSDGDCNASFNEMLFMCGTESEYDITSKEMWNLADNSNNDDFDHLIFMLYKQKLFTFCSPGLYHF